MASLLDDIASTALSTGLTAGAHVLKGATLGLLDPTQEVAEALGEEVYGAAPKWARTGAEILGGFAPVSGALKGARALIPGVGFVPRALQGFAAGAGLGAARGVIGGETPGEILQGSLLEGAFFGGLEGLLGIPEMTKPRKLKELQRLWARYGLTQTEKTLNPGNITTEALVDEGMDSAADLFQTALEEAGQIPIHQRPPAIKLTQDFIDNKNLLLYFKLMGEDMTVQTIDRLVTGKLYGWDKTDLVLELADGTMEKFPFKDFKMRGGAAKNRIFRGGMESHQFPRNTAYELKMARGQAKRMEGFLFRQGIMRKSDLKKLRDYVNPRVKTLAGWTEHELHVYSSYLTKLRKGESLPDQIMEQIKIYGPAATDAGMGFLSTFRPARFMFEALGRKLPWMMEEYFEPALKAVARRNTEQTLLMDRVRRLAQGLSRKQLKKIYELDRYMADNLKIAADQPMYPKMREGMMNILYRKLEREYGKTAATRMRKAHDGFREMFDEMFQNLVKAGVIPKQRYIKEYWPLLRDQSVLSFLFGGSKTPLVPNLPEHIKGFMEYVRKGLIDNPNTDILKLSQIYINTYTKILHLKPEVSKMYRLFKDFKVKSDVRDIMKHYLSRQLGMPSEIDYRLANTLRGLPFFKGLTTKGLVRVAGMLNNLPYYAHMGMRPFAAARNLLQPMITTGPFIGNRWLVQGYAKLFTAEGRAYIRDIKGLQESLGEYSRRTQIRPGKIDKAANTMMWMFRKSDEMNRMVSGLGALSKFEHYHGKLGLTEEFFTKVKLRRFRPSVRTQLRDKAKVYRALEELKTHKYPKGSPAYDKAMKTIKEFSHGESYKTSTEVYKDIRDTYVREAIGDTQWLYGKEQSPMFGYRAGAPGRLALTYQTWWLNYAEFLKNLGRTAKGGDMMPLATAMANNMVLMFALTQVLDWDVKKGLRTIALGPFTGRTPFIEGEAPPQIDPFIKLLGGVRAAVGGDVEGMEKRLETALKKVWDNWIPGSLVYKELSRIGVTPSLELFGQKLTPSNKYRYGTTSEKLISVFGGGRK